MSMSGRTYRALPSKADELQADINARPYVK